MPASTDTATHVYVKKENPKGLMQSFVGPYKIVDRPSNSTIKIKVGTFKNGAENIQLHHWSNAKPANLRADFTEAEMPTRGRPKLVKPSPDVMPASNDTPTSNENQTQTVGSEAAKTKVAGNPAGKVNKHLPQKRAQPAPQRRSERIRAKNHETSTLDWCNRPWSANAREIQKLNASITIGKLPNEIPKPA